MCKDGGWMPECGCWCKLESLHVQGKCLLGRMCGYIAGVWFSVGEACLAVTCKRPCVCASTGGKIQTHTIAFELAKRKCSWMLMVQTCNFSRWEVKEFKGIHLWLQERGRMLREKKYWGAEEGRFLKGIPRCFQEIPGISGAHVPRG